MDKKLPGTGRELEELKRTARILEEVQMIAGSPKRFRRKEFAARFEISERMITKDFDIIRQSLKLSLKRSPQGYYFDDVPLLPAVQLPIDEALAVLLAVQAARQISGVGSPELAAATSRLESLFPQGFAPLLNRLVAQPPVTAQGQHRHEMLMLLNRALGEGRKVRMSYRSQSSGGQVKDRVVHPYHIMPYVRSWMLIAHCERRDAVLMFKVDRIVVAELLEETYQSDPSFDPNEYMGDTWGALRGESFEPENVVLHFDADTGSRVTEEEWHSSQHDETLSDGRIKFTLRVGITPEFVSWLLYYGRNVEVVKPEWLRTRVAQEHARALQTYHQCDDDKEV